MSPTPLSTERIGATLAILAALGFSFKAIFVKLAYLAAPVDAVTLLALRMVFALPVFVWVGLRSGQGAELLTCREWAMVVVLGLLGYYGASMQRSSAFVAAQALGLLSDLASRQANSSASPSA